MFPYSINSLDPMPSWPITPVHINNPNKHNLKYPCNHMPMSMFISPHDPPSCPMEHFKKNKNEFSFLLIKVSYFIPLLVSCHHLGSMLATSPKLPQPYPHFSIVVPPPFHIYLFFLLSHVLYKSKC